MSSFKVFHVAPEQPTNLADRTSIPLPGSDLDPELIVNSITIPRPLETDRLRVSLAKTLQLFPLHCGTLKREVTGNAWSIRLTNRPVRLVVGVTDNPGPFSDQWMGETHSDYYEEIDRETMFSERDTPLFLAKVTTWRETGQTALFVCIWHGLGDAFAALHFLMTWSALYQGKPPPGDPTFSKFFLPAPEILSTSSYTSELSRLSYLSLAFEPEFCARRNTLIKEQTVRLDIDVAGCFVDKIWASVKQESPVNNGHVGRGDAFSGYLIAALQGSFEKPVETLFQFVSARGRSATYNGQNLYFPRSTQGNVFVLWSTPITTAPNEQTPRTLAQTLFRGRSSLADRDRLGRALMLTNYLWSRAFAENKRIIDSGFQDAIIINWLVGIGGNEAHFGFPLESGNVDWESTEKFVQVWNANPMKQTDGTWRRDPGGVHILLRLQPRHATKFLEKLRQDMDRLSIEQSYPSSPTSLIRRLQDVESHGLGVESRSTEKAML
ncbi:Chloramphenicol acetyltransferase-like domain protein [Metarhizium robertsii ARSEF 23]|uniref:Chloramphenicol acetyltransferase-like domain protein n=1 Tax=Metarhizium robertsii (strain ARSEF 23 / ATCC MYA-3075) TaxID=655844 RepID=E9FAR4_METRA|nr:Chloramphenicol acetyltransferase-like domain protein [Metarhizium robertsii ARSEF 23]EFY95158.2 Chloramphenicol acetyltransferase-like domain protein [Metarhizium robertsii ARSEF 23]